MNIKKKKKFNAIKIYVYLTSHPEEGGLSEKQLCIFKWVCLFFIIHVYSLEKDTLLWSTTHIIFTASNTTMKKSKVRMLENISISNNALWINVWNIISFIFLKELINNIKINNPSFLFLTLTETRRQFWDATDEGSKLL